VAVLGALSVEPMTGYEIQRGIEASIGHFWSESYGQIYPVLKELERSALVTSEPTPTGRGRRFTITEAGRDALRELLLDLGDPPPPRNTLLLQLFFGRQLGPEWCRQRVADARHEAEEQIRLLDAIAETLSADDEHPDHHAYWLSTISFGRVMAEALIDWADRVSTTFPDDPSAPPDRER
jgi:DNA-binding PadR family transcriptional regulator